MNNTNLHVALRVAAFSVLPILATTARAQPLPPALNGHDLIIVIDMTGSMNAGVTLSSGAPGIKLDVAKAAALGWLASQPTDNSGTPGVTVPTPTEVSVWKFQGTAYTELQPFTTNFLTAASAIGALTETPSMSTPLAMTMCDLSQALQRHSFVDANGDGVYQPNEGDPFTHKHMYVGTDGQENSTPGYYPTDPLPHHACGGPDSLAGTAYPNYTINSWQWHVRNMLILGEPDGDADGTLNSGVILDVDYIFNSFIPSMMRMSLVATPSSAVPLSVKRALFEHDRIIAAAELSFAPAAARRSVASAAPAFAAVSVTQSDQALFAGLAAETDGRFTVVSPNPATGKYDLDDLAAPAGRIPGDVDYNGCVNDVDLSSLFLVLGKTASSSIEADRADVDESGLVDNADYLMVLRNYGSGPNC